MVDLNLLLTAYVYTVHTLNTSLPHYLSSQGWASRCPLLYIMFVCQSYGWVGYLTLLFFFLNEILLIYLLIKFN